MEAALIRVLLVEDDEEDFFLASEMFAEIEGGRYDLEWARTYEAGLAAIQELRHDVYLLDHRLGARHGMELLREAIALGCSAPLILMTGYGTREADLQAMKSGAADYLVKGRIDADSLERSIRYAIERNQAAEALRRAHAEMESRVEQRTRELVEINTRLQAEIAERKRAEDALRESQQRLEMMVESAKDYAIFSASLEGRISTWNSGAARLFGYDESEVLDQPLALLFTAEDVSQGVPQQELSKAAANGRAEDERWHARKDGSRFFASGVVTPLRDEAGSHCGFTKVARDITERKQLLDEVQQRAEDLAEADRRKDEFLAMLAHELRNPLAPICHAIEIFRRYPLPDPMLEKTRDILDRQVQQMVRLVDDLLDVSRITRGKIELRKKHVDVATIVTRAVETSQPLIQARRHALSVVLPPEPISLEADPTRLAQILSNLLNNAAKYTEPGGQVWLEVQRDSDQVLIRVRDTGIGIPPEMLPHVFDMFIQVERTLDRSQGGLGIGLTLVRRLVEMHGGSVAVSSPGVGQGSEFTVQLPAA